MIREMLRLVAIWAALAGGLYGLGAVATWLVEQDWYDAAKPIFFGIWTLAMAGALWLMLPRRRP